MQKCPYMPLSYNHKVISSNITFANLFQKSIVSAFFKCTSHCCVIMYGINQLEIALCRLIANTVIRNFSVTPLPRGGGMHIKLRYYVECPCNLDTVSFICIGLVIANLTFCMVYLCIMHMNTEL